MHLTLIRHAESVWNATGQWQGQSDVPLSPRGRLQVRALSQRMFGEVFDHRYCSDLSRASETAAALGEPAHADARYREIDVGQWAGLRRREVGERFGDEIEALRAGAPVRIGGGESMDEFEVRVDAAVEMLRHTHAGERVLLVTHGGFVRALTTGVLDVRGRLSPLVGVGNTAISTVREIDGRLCLERYNDGRHLSNVDQDSALMRLPEPSTRVAIITCDPAIDAGRSLVDAVLGSLRIPRYVAPAGTLDAPLARGLNARPLPPGGVDALREEHQGDAFGLVLHPERIAGAIGALLRITEEGARGFAPPEHGSIAQVRLFADRGDLYSFGVSATHP